MMIPLVIPLMSGTNNYVGILGIGGSPHNLLPVSVTTSKSGKTPPAGNIFTGYWGFPFLEGDLACM